MSCLKRLSVLPELSRSSFFETDAGDLKAFFTMFTFLVFGLNVTAMHKLIKILFRKYKYLLQI